MPLPGDLPVVDHHCHLSPTGEGVAAARRFRDAGGSHLFLTTQSYSVQPPSTLEGYAEQFRTTEELARRIREDTGVVTYCVLAPYPVDLLSAEATLGLEAAVDLHRAALDLAAREVEEQRAVALGEVGRPHFPIDPRFEEAVETCLAHALEVARDAGCPAVIHSEDLDGEGYRRLARTAAQVGFPLGKLVKHYARHVTPPRERAGVVPSFLARRDLVSASLDQPGPWFWETDFLDDPARPGAVLDIATVPRRARAVAEDPARVGGLRTPFVTSVEAVYGVTPTVDRRGGP